jgi:twitching motility protein PilT
VGVDGDVDSYYLGALDALRERPDVIVIGEIRDAQTAQEALALAESGPLVLATLHARSTELGLQKMLRLLGNSDAQGQALAHALRGVLCQALLPSKQGNRYHLATECLSISPAVAEMIEAGDLGAIRAHMNAGREAGLPHDEQRAGRAAGFAQGGVRMRARRRPTGSGLRDGVIFPRRN